VEGISRVLHSAVLCSRRITAVYKVIANSFIGGICQYRVGVDHAETLDHDEDQRYDYQESDSELQHRLAALAPVKAARYVSR